MRLQRLILILICVLMILAGCSSKAPSQHDEGKGSVDPAKTIAESKYKNGDKAAFVLDNIVVNSPVIMPALQSDKIATYRAPTVQYDYETAEKLLLADRKIESMNESNEPGDGYRSYTLSDGCFAYIGERDGLFVGTDFSDIIRTVFTYEVPAYSDLISSNSDQFDKDVDFGFKPKMEAYKEIEAVLHELGIEEIELSHAYSLDYQTLKQEEDKLAADENFQYLIQEGRAELKEDWSEADNCYYFVMRNVVDGIPVDEIGYQSENETSIEGNKITAIYSKNGIEDLSISTFFRKGECLGENAVISLEVALDYLDDSFDDLIITTPLIVTMSEFKYVGDYIENSSMDMKLVPAWSFIVEQEMVDETSKETDKRIGRDVVNINAIDGSLIR